MLIMTCLITILSHYHISKSHIYEVKVLTIDLLNKKYTQHILSRMLSYYKDNQCILRTCIPH